MATLDDLAITPLSKLSPEQGMNLILEMRLRRRSVPERPAKEKVTNKRNLPPESVIANLSEKQLADLYYTLAAKMQKELL